MAAVGIIDIIDGAEIQQTSAGYTATRIVNISGLTGPGFARLSNALLVRGLPRIDSDHPTLPIRLTSIRVAGVHPNNASVVRVILGYGNHNATDEAPAGKTEAPPIEVGATLQSKTTDTELDGTQIEVVYRKTEAQPGGGETTQFLRRNAKVSLQAPLVNISLTRRENESPLNKAERFVGTVNSVTLFDGDGPRTWLCTRITGRSSDLGQTYVVNYAFQRADRTSTQDTWDVLLAYVDPETGDRPDDATLGDGASIPANGMRLVQVYREENFLQLGIFPQRTVKGPPPRRIP